MSRSSSPPLPTFGIRDLCGPAPALISITKRQYESTIKSQPDAKLLYLDDDDGELITVGSSLELKQRLEEPIARYALGTHVDTYNPTDGNLVHVFDIQHSAGSIAEWRDHQAYSSKIFRPPSCSSPSLRSSPIRIDADPCKWWPSAPSLQTTARSLTGPTHSTAEDGVKDLEKGCALDLVQQVSGADSVDGVDLDLDSDSDSDSASESDSFSKYLERLSKLGRATGSRSPSFQSVQCPFCPWAFPAKVECRQHQLTQHLNLLSENERRLFTNNIQQDQSVQVAEPQLTVAHSESLDVLGGIEEHLNGLANVLQTAAATFQKAASKTRETDTTVVEDILKGVKNILFEVGSFGVEAFKEINRLSDPQTPCSSNSPTPPSAGEPLLVPEQDQHPSSDGSQQSDGLSEFDDAQPTPSTTSVDSDSTGSTARVKFAFVESETEDSVEPQAVPHSAPTFASKDSDCEDDASEYKDASPSLTGIKITNPFEEVPIQRLGSPSILDDSSEDADFTARYPPLNSVRRARSTIESGTQKYRSFVPALPNRRFTNTFPRDGSFKPDILVASRRAQEASETDCKPLPGAWPEARNETVPTLPNSSESSGTFFNRMTGRDQSRDHPSSGLRRANTTASSNPASRLNGPFDPGFPYEPTKTNGSGSRSSRHTKITARDVSNQVEACIASSKGLARLNAKRSVPNFACSARKGPITLVDARPKSSTREPFGFSKFESHRGVKHHRSVPHFQPYGPPPPFVHTDRSGLVRPNWMSQLSTPPADYLMDSNLPQVPPTTFPVIAPQPYVPNPVTPAPPAPQLRPFSGSPVLPASPTAGAFYQPSPPIGKSTTSPPNGGPYPWYAAHRPSFSPESSSPAPARPDASNDMFDHCVAQLQMCGFGIDDDNLKDRLHVYAVAAGGNVEEAVDMIEQDRRVSGRFE